MQDIITRPATAADMDAIYSFVCRLEDEIFDRPLFAAYYAQCISAPGHYYIVAWHGETPVGYISCHGQLLLHHCSMVHEIQEMFVDDAWRSKGVGRKLLHALEETLVANGAQLLEVCSNIRRTDAHRFYETNSFVRTTYKFKKEINRSV